MKVVVTGASGFLGRIVIQRLTATTGTIVPVSRQAVPGAVRVASYADTPSGDVLIHLAEGAHRAVAELAGPVYEHQALDVLSTLLRNRYECVIYASSAVLYGDQARTPRRTDDEVFVSDAYTRVKRRSEIAVLESGGIVARLSNLFGPGMSNHNVMSTILRQIPGVGPVYVRDTEPVRDFIWAEDAADALVRMARRAGAGIFNIGTGIGYSIRDVAKSALSVTGQTDRAIVATQRAAQLSHLVLDISDTMSTWQWSPDTTLREGIGRLLSAATHTNS